MDEDSSGGGRGGGRPDWLQVQGDGRWVPAQQVEEVDVNALSPAERKQFEALEAIGYVAGKHAAVGKGGVTLNDPDRAAGGITLITDAHAAAAYLVDAAGTILHKWQRNYQDVFPRDKKPHKNKSYWRRTALLPDGGLIGIFDGYGIVHLDKDSNVLFSSSVGAHHDLEVLPDGSVWTLTRKTHKVPQVDPDKFIREDFVTLLDPEMNEVKSISVLKALHQSEFKPDWTEVDYGAAGDVMHTNSIQLLDGRFAAAVPAFKAGNFLLSSPILNELMVLDPEQERIVWTLQGDFAFQHDPQLLPDGHLTVFDNQGRMQATGGKVRESSVQELDPATGEVLWEYRGNQVMPFFSETCGAAQRLPNGNTLVSETDRGRAFEVTPDGDVVWEYLVPFQVEQNGRKYVACMMEAWRLPGDFPLDWME